MFNSKDIKLYDSVTAKRSSLDEIEAKFFIGQKVKLLNDVVNDGTYPYLKIGNLMMKKSSIGYIKDMGDFLQVIRIYEVHFFDTNADVEIIGCREHELEAIEDYGDIIAEEIEIIKNHRAKMKALRKNKTLKGE